jgi:hypothetical protein
MPMTFPSHQGLIAPLWRRWPHRFDVAALCVGAAMPDVVDLPAVLWRGHFGQGIGHSLIGMALIGFPLGLLLCALVCRVARCLTRSRGNGFLACAWNRGLAALATESTALPSRARRVRIASSLALGVFSHLAFDLVSHGYFPWLLPWVPKLAIFPEWWYDTWVRISLPWGSEGRKMGPHAAIWTALSVWGAWMLVRPVFQAWRTEKR